MDRENSAFSRINKIKALRDYAEDKRKKFCIQRFMSILVLLLVVNAHVSLAQVPDRPEFDLANYMITDIVLPSGVSAQVQGGESSSKIIFEASCSLVLSSRILPLPETPYYHGPLSNEHAMIGVSCAQSSDTVDTIKISLPTSAELGQVVVLTKNAPISLKNGSYPSLAFFPRGGGFSAENFQSDNLRISTKQGASLKDLYGRISVTADAGITAVNLSGSFSLSTKTGNINAANLIFSQRSSSYLKAPLGEIILSDIKLNPVKQPDGRRSVLLLNASAPQVIVSTPNVITSNLKKSKKIVRVAQLKAVAQKRVVLSR